VRAAGMEFHYHQADITFITDDFSGPTRQSVRCVCLCQYLWVETKRWK